MSAGPVGAPPDRHFYTVWRRSWLPRLMELIRPIHCECLSDRFIGSANWCDTYGRLITSYVLSLVWVMAYNGYRYSHGSFPIATSRFRGCINPVRVTPFGIVYRIGMYTRKWYTAGITSILLLETWFNFMSMWYKFDLDTLLNILQSGNSRELFRLLRQHTIYTGVLMQQCVHTGTWHHRHIVPMESCTSYRRTRF
jgi:hypothetical protein